MPEAKEGRSLLRWSEQDIARFRRALVSAKEKNEEQFTFDGKQYLTSYAHYLNSYLISRGF